MHIRTIYLGICIVLLSQLVVAPTVCVVWKGVSCWLFDGSQDGISKGVQLFIYGYISIGTNFPFVFWTYVCNKWQELPKGNWLCCNDCKRIHSTLRNVLVRGAERLPQSLLALIKKKQGEKGLDPINDINVSWRLLSGKNASPETRPLLLEAVSIFHVSSCHPFKFIIILFVPSFVECGNWPCFFSNKWWSYFGIYLLWILSSSVFLSFFIWL